MCTRVLTLWHKLVKLYGVKENDDTCTIYDTSSENESPKYSDMSSLSRSSSRYNLRTRKPVKYTDDSDDEVDSGSRSPVSRGASSRGASSHDD